MSLFTLNTVCTPRNRVFGRLKQYINIYAANARTSKTRFLASLLTLTREPRIKNQFAKIKAKFDKRIAGSGASKQILTTRKRSDIIWHLQNPTAALRGATPAKKASDSNIKYEAKCNYELQDNQAYRKAMIDKETGQSFPARYAITYSDIFANITATHESLMHFSQSSHTSLQSPSLSSHYYFNKSFINSNYS